MAENRRDYAIRLRTTFGLRADPGWVDHVAATGRDGGMTLNIPLTDDEFADLHARHDRTALIGAAVREAALPSAAGLWIEQVAGGLVHVLLAHPGAGDRAAAEAIVAGQHAVVDIVEHSTADLEHVRTLVHQARRADPGFAAAIVGYGIGVQRNTLDLQLRHDADPAIPDALQHARTTGALSIEYTELRWYAD